VLLTDLTPYLLVFVHTTGMAHFNIMLHGREIQLHIGYFRNNNLTIEIWNIKIMQLDLPYTASQHAIYIMCVVLFNVNIIPSHFH
jgi:hypothetical protein